MILVSLVMVIGAVVGLVIVLRRQRALVRGLREEMARLEREAGEARTARTTVHSTRRLAHDMNNMLGMIAGYSHLLQRGIDAASPMRPRIDNILKATDRATVMTRELLELSRSLAGEGAAASGGAVVASAAPLDLKERLTILLVEDEASLREILHEVLDDAGYRVLAASAAHDALAAVQAHRGPIHLMLADVNLPGTSGPELAAQIRFQHAAARVLYMSGHSEEIVARRGAAHPAAPLIQKPFTPTTLLQRVQELSLIHI